MAKDPFYVGIENAISLRKDLLLSSKDILTALKRHEVLKEIRQAKVESYFELRTVMEELMVLNRKLRGALPKTSIKPELKIPEAKKTAAIPTRSQITRIEKKQKDQLDVLQDAMARVEEQLKELE